MTEKRLQNRTDGKNGILRFCEKTYGLELTLTSKLSDQADTRGILFVLMFTQ